MAVAVLAALVGYPAAAAPPAEGSSVYLGSDTQQGHAGTYLAPVYLDQADAAAGEEPDFWAYCIEQSITQRLDRNGVVGDWSSFVGDNYFKTDPTVPPKVAWVLINGYPAKTVAQLSADSGVAGLTATDAVEAMQYAIWRYTDLTFDAPWSFGTTASEDLYYWLLAGANSSGYSEADLAAMAASVTLTAPTVPQVAGSLVGPVTLSTDAPSATVTVEPPTQVVDSSGDPIDLSAVSDGQEMYLDLQGTDSAGSVEFTAAVQSSAGTGMVVNVDAEAGPDRSQSLILVTAAGGTTTATATVRWNGTPAAPDPSIGTTVAVVGSPAKELSLTGGTVIDTVAYEGLTPGVEYVLSGFIHTVPDGTDTGISATRTFVPTDAAGEVDVTFTITAAEAAAFAGQELVVFERLTLAGDPVAEHVDPTDENQTFRVADETPVDTTEPDSAPPTTVESTTTVDTSGTATGGPVTRGSLPRTGTEPNGLVQVAALAITAGATALGLRHRLANRRR